MCRSPVRENPLLSKFNGSLQAKFGMSAEPVILRPVYKAILINDNNEKENLTIHVSIKQGWKKGLHFKENWNCCKVEISRKRKANG